MHSKQLVEMAGIRDHCRERAIPGYMLRQLRNGLPTDVPDGVLPLGYFAQEIGAGSAVRWGPGRGGAVKVRVDDEFADDLRCSRDHALRVGAEIRRRVGLDTPGRDVKLLGMGIDVEFRPAEIVGGDVVSLDQGGVDQAFGRRQIIVQPKPVISQDRIRVFRIALTKSSLSSMTPPGSGWMGR